MFALNRYELANWLTHFQNYIKLDENINIGLGLSLDRIGHFFFAALILFCFYVFKRPKLGWWITGGLLIGKEVLDMGIVALYSVDYVTPGRIADTFWDLVSGVLGMLVYPLFLKIKNKSKD